MESLSPIPFRDSALDGRTPAHCAVCRETPETLPTTCPRCGALYHSECWRYNRGCAIYGCLPPAVPRKSRAFLRMVESPPDLHVVSNLDWGEFHRRVPMRRDPQVPFSGLRWRLVQACVVTLSYVMLGGVCVLMSGPLLLIAALHFYPPF